MYEEYGRDASINDDGMFTEKGYIYNNRNTFTEWYDGRDVPEEYRVTPQPPQPERPDPSKVLHNEACDAHKELHRHKAREITFSDLTLEEARQLHTFDEYFKGEIAFERAGKKITPKLLLEAIRTLPEEKRKAVLLYYFEGMNDTEIAELFDTSRSTIQYRRTSSFELLKKYLEENADEWDEW